MSAVVSTLFSLAATRAPMSACHLTKAYTKRWRTVVNTNFLREKCLERPNLCAGEHLRGNDNWEMILVIISNNCVAYTHKVRWSFESSVI